MKTKVNVSYIAGFFDADGSFDKVKGDIIITNKVKYVLEEIQKTLTKLNIESVIRKQDGVTPSGKPTFIYRLYIRKMLSVKRYIEKVDCIIPYKKEGMLNYYNKNIRFFRRAKTMKELHSLGNSYREIGKILNVPFTYVGKVLTGKIKRYRHFLDV